VDEKRTIGPSLDAALGNALRDRQREDIEETLNSLEALEPDIDIHVHDAAGQPMMHSKGAVLDTEIEELVARAARTKTELVEFQPAEDSARLVFAAPLTADDGT